MVAQAEARAPYIMPVPSVPTNSYDVSGYSYRNGSYIHGSIDNREGSKSVDGYIYDSAGNSIYVEGEWTGNGEVEVYDSQGNSYELEVD